MDESEFITYNDPQVRTLTQFLLVDDLPKAGLSDPVAAFEAMEPPVHYIVGMRMRRQKEVRMSKVVLDDADIGRAITRISHEILERNKGAQDLVLLGIPSRGYPLAQRIAVAALGNELANPRDAVGPRRERVAPGGRGGPCGAGGGRRAG